MKILLFVSIVSIGVFFGLGILHAAGNRRRMPQGEQDAAFMALLTEEQREKFRMNERRKELRRVRRQRILYGC